jgi:hypothetical protein
MNHSEHVADARAREQRARERETRAMSLQRAADRMAREGTDPQTVLAHRAKAKMHARAAKVHGEAVKLQAEHAREHEF